MTDLSSKVRRDGSRMALAAVGVLVVVAVGFGVFVASIRVLLPAVYPHVPADPTLVAAVVGFGPAAVYGVVVAVLVRRRVVNRG